MTGNSTDTVRIEDPKDAPKVCVHAFNAGDIDVLANLFEPEAVIILPPGQVIKGPAGIRELYTQIPATCKRWEIKLITIIEWEISH
jgi:ketosteroid isomerase-like protein